MTSIEVVLEGVSVKMFIVGAGARTLAPPFGAEAGLTGSLRAFAV